jgi:hypothetical protein
MSELVRCSACGGSVVYDVGRQGGTCMFCGSIALSAVAVEEPLPVPHAVVPLEVDGATADARFRAWSRSSWWYPAELRALRIEVRAMLLPAWRFSSQLESHWAGLERAATRSGKRPRSGQSHAETTVMVPASGGVSGGELHALEPYDEARAHAWDAAAAALPWEPPATTEQGAREQAHATMARWHASVIAGEQHLTSCNVSPVIDDRDVRLLMVPIHIGAFRYRDRPWRFLINGQTGKVVGEAPIDRIKVALVGLGSVALVALVVALVAVLR